jgi:hypothetical protein
MENRNSLSSINPEKEYESETTQEPPATNLDLYRESFRLVEGAVAEENKEERERAKNIFLLGLKPKKKEARPTYQHIYDLSQELAEKALKELGYRLRLAVRYNEFEAQLTLQTKGVPNPNKLLKLLEADRFFRYAYHPQLHLMSPEQIANHFYSAYHQITSNEFIHVCKQIGNIDLAYERLLQMGGGGGLHEEFKLSNTQFISMCQKLTKISEGQFNSMLEQLKQFSFLFPDKHAGTNYLRLEPLILFIESNAQITAEERQVFETAQQIYELSCSGYVDHHLIVTRDPKLLLSKGDVLRDELIVLEQLILDLYKNDKYRRYFDEENYFTFRFRNIVTLQKDGDLHKLAELVRNGFSIGRTYSLLFFNEFDNDPESLTAFQEEINIVTTLYDQFSNENTRSEMLFLEDFLPHISQQKVLVIEKIFETIFSERQSYINTLKVVLDFINNLEPNTEQRLQLFERFVFLDDKIGIGIKISEILKAMKSSEVLDRFPTDDKLFWQQIINWGYGKFEDLKNEEDFISIFFIQNRDRFKDFFKDGKLTDDFFYKFSSFFKKIPEEYYLDHKINKSKILHQINSFLLHKDSAAPCISEMGYFLLKSDEEVKQAVLVTDNVRWVSCFKDGKPNIDLVSLVLDSSEENVKIAVKLLTADVMGQLTEDQKKFWDTWIKIADYSTEIALFLYKNRGQFTKYVNNESFTPDFLYEFNNCPGNRFTDEELKTFIETGFLHTFSRIDFAIWRALRQTKRIDRFELIHKIDKIKKHFNEEGRPTVQLLTYLAKFENEELLQNFLSVIDLSSFAEVEQKFWQEWLNLPKEIKVDLTKKFIENAQVTQELFEEVINRKFLFEKIEQFKLPELIKVKAQLITLLAKDPQREVVLRRVIDLFVSNNLPDLARRFEIFILLYLTPSNGVTRFEEESNANGLLSKALKKALKGSPRKIINIIYADLLKISIDSGEVSLRNYLAALQEGQDLLDRLESHGIENLSPTETKKVTRFLNRLNALHENSSLGRHNTKNTTPFSEILNVNLRIINLKKDLKVRDGQKIIDRVLEMFARPLGLNSIAEVIARMDRNKSHAHLRNLNNPGVKNGQIVIKPGDLLKGISPDILSYILQNGSVAREYTGVAATSDRTPFDTDVEMVRSINRSFAQAIAYSIAKEYGDLVLVVRDRGQFARTDLQNENEPDQNKYELYQQGLAAVNHYGIRTGFPSIEIDAIVFTKTMLDESQASALKRDQTFFNIANNGFYIPVVNPEGKVIFTEEDYNQYRLNQIKITDILNGQVFDPIEFINLLKKSPYLKVLYEMDSGVREGYSTEKHTLMVMNQFEKYFSKNFYSTLLSIEEFRLMLSLHDIGKPLGVFITGSSSSQHEYTMKVLTYVLQATGISPLKFDTIVRLVDQDILGDYFKGNYDVDRSIHQINALAKSIGVLAKDLIDILRIFYISDAGSYTIDAGGTKASLDRIFKFYYEDGERKVTFSDHYEESYQNLLKQIET